MITFDREYAAKASFANFRFLHARLRVFTEPIAIYHGEQLERVRLDAAFEDVVAKVKHVIWGQVWVYAVSSFVFEIQSFLATPLVSQFAEFRAGDIGAFFLSGQTTSALEYRTLSAIMQLSMSGELLGFANRVGDLHNKLALLRAQAHDQEEATFDSDTFEFRDVQLCTPQGRVLQQQPLSFSVPLGSAGLVILGRSGCGKSTLLRLMAGFLRPERGRMGAPSASQVFLMPQRPYLVDGSLKQQVLYPLLKGDHDVESLLDAVGLGSLVRRFRLDEVRRWGDILSLGEQQRLGF